MGSVDSIEAEVRNPNGVTNKAVACRGHIKTPDQDEVGKN